MMDSHHAKQEGVWIYGAPVVTMGELAAFRMRVADAIERRSQFNDGSPAVTPDELTSGPAGAGVPASTDERGEHGN